MFKYNLTCTLKTHFISSYLKRLLNLTLKSATHCLKLQPKVNYFDLFIVNDDEIQRLNSIYRHKETTTDVISLQYNPSFQFVNLQFNHLGEIYIDYYKIEEQAKKYHHTFAREFCFLVLHGVLHLIGYDHLNKEDEQLMFGLQEKILQQTKKSTLMKK